MRRLTTVVLAIAFSVPMIAQQSVEDLLNAPNVTETARVRVDNGKLYYKTDKGGFVELKSGQTIVSRSPGITIAYADYNPFQIGVAANVTGSVDPASKAVSDFIAALRDTAGAVFPAAMTAEAVETKVAALSSSVAISAQTAQANAQSARFAVASARRDLEQKRDEVTRIEARMQAAQAERIERSRELNTLSPSASKSTKARVQSAFDVASKQVTTANAELQAAQAAYFLRLAAKESAEEEVKQALIEEATAANCRKVADAISSATAAIRTSRDTIKDMAAALRTWQSAAMGRSGVSTQLASVQTSAGTILKAIVEAEAAKKALDDLSLSTDQDVCDPLKRSEILGLYNIAANIGNVVSADKQLLQSLNQLADTLSTYKTGQWVAGTSADSDYVFVPVTVSSDTLQTVAMTFTPKTYATSGDSQMITVKDGTMLTANLIVRAGRPFVPELGLAAIYNEIEYPKYTADKQADGTFVVGRTIDKSNVDAAMTLNFFCNCLPNTSVYPGFQIGVSKTKDYPGVLLGGVLRFSQMKRIAISAGGMVTWYKELSTLHKGDEVPGQEAIDKDLKRKAATGFYFGVQFTFGTP
jgi:hypothetical protein